MNVWDEYLNHPDWPEFWKSYRRPESMRGHAWTDEMCALHEFSERIRDERLAEQQRERAARLSPPPPATIPAVAAPPPKRAYDLETPDGRMQFNAERFSECMRSAANAVVGDERLRILSAVAAAIAVTTETQRELRVELEARVKALEEQPTAHERIDGLEARIVDLEEQLGALEVQRGADRARIQSLEERPELKYRGTWTEGEYPPGSFVSHCGSMFYAHCHTLAQPGASDNWQIVVRRGRDGKGKT